MLVYIASKNWAIAIRFIITIIYLNSFAKIVGPLSLNHMLVKIRIKKLQKSNEYNIIYNMDVLLLIINALINKFCLMHLANKWEKQKVTIYIWCFNVIIVRFVYLPVILIPVIVLCKSFKLNKFT